MNSRTHSVKRVGPWLAAIVGVASLLATAAPALQVQAVSPAPWTANLTGNPAPNPPLAFCSAEFDCHVTNQHADAAMPLMQAQHGTDCSAFPNTHPVSTYVDGVFQCNNHVMTAVASTTCCPVVQEGYAEAELTPAYLVDISGGTTQVSYHVSTNRTSGRDWYEIFLTPYSENLVTPVDAGNAHAVQGPPKDGFEIDASGIATNHGTALKITEYVNYVATSLPANFVSIESKVGGYDSSIRTPFELDFSSSHIRFGIPACAAGVTGCVGTTMGTACPTGGCAAYWWYDANFPTALASTQYVLQFTHHDYDPFKGSGGPCVPSGEEQCLPDTWHWSDISIGSAVPFTVDKPVPGGGIDSTGSTAPFSRPQNCTGDGCDTFLTATFSTPTPANAYLRFAMIGQAWYSTDGGVTWTAVVRQQQQLSAQDTFATFWTPVPAGLSSIQIKVTTAAQFPGIPGMVRDISVWATQ